MAKAEPTPVTPEAVEAPAIVIPFDLVLDDDCVVIAADETSVTVEKAGKKYNVTPGAGAPLLWNWVEIV